MKVLILKEDRGLEVGYHWCSANTIISILNDNILYARTKNVDKQTGKVYYTVSYTRNKNLSNAWDKRFLEQALVRITLDIVAISRNYKIKSKVHEPLQGKTGQGITEYEERIYGKKISGNTYGIKDIKRYIKSVDILNAVIEDDKGVQFGYEYFKKQSAREFFDKELKDGIMKGLTMDDKRLVNNLDNYSQFVQFLQNQNVKIGFYGTEVFKPLENTNIFKDKNKADNVHKTFVTKEKDTILKKAKSLFKSIFKWK